MDQTNDGWGPPVGSSQQQMSSETYQEAPKQPELLSYVNQQISSGAAPDSALSVAMQQPQFKDIGNKYSFQLSPDGKSFLDHGIDQGWGPSLGKFKPPVVNTPTDTDSTIQKIGQAVTGTVSEQAGDLKDAMVKAYQRIKFRTENPNLPAQEMTPEEASAAKLLGYHPASMAGAGAQYTSIQPSSTGQRTGQYFYERSPKLPADYGTTDNAPRTDTLEQPLVSIPTKSLPSNFLQFLANAPLQQEYQYQQIHKVLDQQAIVSNPSKYNPQQVAQAKKYLAGLPGEDKKTAAQYMKDVAQQFQDHPKEMGIGLINGILADPEMLVGGEGELTALSDAAKTAGASTKAVNSIRRVENAVHGAVTGATFGGTTEAGQQLSSTSGNISPVRLLSTAATGAAIGGALGAARGIHAAEPVAGGDKLEPDPMEPGWSKPTQPQLPPGAGSKLLTREEVPGEFTSTAQKRLGAPGNVEQPHVPGNPIPTNAPLDDTGHVPYTGGTSENLKVTHIDEAFPNTLDMPDKTGKQVTIPVKDIVSQVHESEEAPLMFPKGPVPVEKIYDLIDRAGPYATTEIFSPKILKDIADGKPLKYPNAHEIATAIENHHVETHYNVDPVKVYQPSMKPYIKDIAKRSEDIPKNKIAVDLASKPYDDMGHPEVVEGQSKPSVGGLPGESPGELNASGESAASLEAINRFRQERAANQDRYLIDRHGNVVPLMMAEDVDRVARPGQVIVQRGIGKDPWTILSHGDDVSPDVAKGKVNAAASKLAQAGRIDPKLLRAIAALGIGALAGSYLYKKHPIKGALQGAGLALALSGAHPIKFLAALRDVTSGDKRLNISSFLDTRDGMMADSQRARMQAQIHLQAITPKMDSRIKINSWLDGDKNQKLTPKEQQAAQYARNVYDSLGKTAMQHGVLDEMIQDYNARRWQPTKNRDSIIKQILAQKQKASPTGTTSVHNLQRSFVTLAEGKAAGLIPVTEDYIANLGMYWDSMTRTIANKITLDSLKNARVPGTTHTLIMRALDKNTPADYIGNARIPGMRVHPDIAQTLSSVYNLKDTNPFLNGLQAVNTLQKRWEVMGSIFHAVSLIQAHYSATPITKIPEATGDIIKSLFGKSKAHDILRTGGPKDDVGLLLRNGMKVQLPNAEGVDIDYNQAYYPAIQAVQGYMNSVLPGSGKLVGGLEKVSKLSDRLIFTNAHAGFKLSTGLTYLSKARLNWAQELQRNPNTVIPSDDQIAKEVSSFVNNVYGGLDWRRAAEEAQTELGRMLTYAAYGPVGRSLLSFTFFAPDWLLSTMRSAGKAIGAGHYIRRLTGKGTPEEMLRHIGGSGLRGLVKPKTSTDFHRLYQVRNAVFFFLVASALNQYFSGHGLTKNKNPLRVDMGHGEYMEWNKHGMEAYNAIRDPRQFFLNKLGFIPREVAEWGLDKDYLTVGGHAPAYSGVGQHALQTFTPFSVSNMLDKSPRDIALNLLGLPVYGVTDKQRAARRAENTKARERFQLEHPGKKKPDGGWPQ